MLVREQYQPLDTPLTSGLYWCWLLLLAGLTAVLACWFAFPLSHFASSMSFNYSEGWNAYWDDAARLGQPLYAAPPDLNTTNYPPISFHLVGLLSRLSGGVTIAGRVLALFCLAWSALNIATAATMISRSRRIGAYAALCFLLWVALLTPGRIATNDPHFLALALSTLGVCAYLRAEGRAGWIIAAAVFFATSIFVKNNLLALSTGGRLTLVSYSSSALTRAFRHCLFARRSAVPGADDLR